MSSSTPSSRAPGPPRSPGLADLRCVIEDISGELELEPLLTRILGHACALIGADDGTIGLYDPECDAIRTCAVYRMPERELGAMTPRGQGLSGRVLAGGRPVMSRYGDLKGAALIELADNHVVGVPIRRRREWLGVFGIGAWPPRRFGRADLNVLTLFARHAAIAIDNARRFAEQQRRQLRFQLISRVSAIIAKGLDPDEMLQRAADAIHEILDYPNVDIPLIDSRDPATLVVSIRGGAYKHAIHQIDRLPVAQGIMGAAVREGRTQLVNDVSGDSRYVCPPGVTMPYAELAVPIRAGREVLGVINVEGDHPFDSLDAESLEVVSEHLALALNNARLFDTARQHAVLLERQRLAHDLHDNVTQILSSINLLVESLPAAWRRDPAEGERRSRRLGELAQAAFAEMRALLQQLRPPESVEAPGFAFGAARTDAEHCWTDTLPAALTRRLAAMVPPEIRLKLRFSSWHPQRPECEHALYLVCQEAVSNTIRHASASGLEITAAVRDGGAWLSIADDGIGIDPRACGRGIGLSSMRRRIELLGGRFDIRRRRSRGTLVKARLPRADRESDTGQSEGPPPS